MKPTTLLAAVLTATALTAAGVSVAGATASDGVTVKGQFGNGGTAQLELETRNVRLMICFLLDNPGPTDGDSIRSSIRSTATGAEVLDLGTGDQWVVGSDDGCEIPADGAVARDVFAHPQGYYLAFEVLESPSGGRLGQTFRSGPLQPG